MDSMQKAMDQKFQSVAKLCEENETGLMEHRKHINDLLKQVS
jgi:hypothetical protein